MRREAVKRRWTDDEHRGVRIETGSPHTVPHLAPLDGLANEPQNVGFALLVALLPRDRRLKDRLKDSR